VNEYQDIIAEQTRGGEVIRIASDSPPIDLKTMREAGFRFSEKDDAFTIERPACNDAMQVLQGKNRGDWQPFLERLSTYVNYLDDTDAEVERLQTELSQATP
jgi:hypothetical protein